MTRHLSEGEVQIFEAMFRKDVLSDLDLEWIGVRLHDGRLPPETRALIAARWPRMVAENQRGCRRVVVGTVVTIASLVAAIIAFGLFH